MTIEFSEKYDSSIHEVLKEQDWEAALPRVLRYARSRMKLLAWLGNIDADATEFVKEAAARAYGVGKNGTYRNWNREKFPDLIDFLNSIISSLIDERLKQAKKFVKKSLTTDHDTEVALPTQASSALEPASLVQAEIQPYESFDCPETDVINAEGLDTLVKELKGVAQGNELMELIVVCFEDGIGKPRQIAAEIGCDVKEVNNALRQMRTKLDDFKPSYLRKKG